MTIYLMRHGETEWNKAGRKQGRGNSPLTPTGETQALTCAAAVNIHIDNSPEIIVSPLGRAQATAEIFCNALKYPASNINTVEVLAELDYGLWQGLTDEEIDRSFPDERQERSKNRWNYQIPKGESYAMVDRRISEWLKKQNFSCTVIIAHEMVNRVILRNYLGLNEKETLKLQHPHGMVYQLKEDAVSSL